MASQRFRALLATLLLTTLLGCYQEPVAIATYPPGDSPPPTAGPTPTAESTPTTEPTPIPTAAATGTELPLTTASPLLPSEAPPTGAISLPTEGCVNGWLGPVPGSAEYDEGIATLEGYMGVIGPWSVTEMRYFTGPDVPWIIEPHYDVVERWYIRAALVSDPAYRARWLLEKRTDQIKGVSAVASDGSFGYESPDWTGFVGDGPPTNYLGLPGQWSGIPYDFVTGEGDSGQPGLPDEVVDCLTAT